MKSLAQRLFRSAGYELRRYQPTSSERAQLMTILNHHGVDLVFDVGANTGGFGRHLRELGYRGRMVSFEPLKSAHDKLLSTTERDKLWSVSMRSAIGAESGEVELHIAANSESSSVLEMCDAHSRAAPESHYVGHETVPLRTLDSLAGEYLGNDTKLFLKIDTQGFEEQVLRGAAKTLSRAFVVQLELSLVELYADQRLMPDMVELMKGIGFDLWGMSPVFSDPGSGRVLQMDGIFSRWS